MKPVKLLVFIAISLSFAAGKYLNIEVRNASVPKSEEGIFVFWECKPTDSYEVIGTVHEPIVSLKSGTYSSRRATFVKKAKNEFPQCDGIYYSIDVTGVYDAFVIKFK